MEGNGVYEKAYNEIEKLIKANTSGIITIDYSKLDERTSAEIRSSLTKILNNRRNEVYQVISGVH